MKKKCFLLLLILNFICYSYNKKDVNLINKSNSFSKVNYQKSNIKTDTIRVHQNDTAVFKKMRLLISRPCSRYKSSISYNLINPVNDAYYFIYNTKNQLITEGKYTNEYTYEGAKVKKGNFYNSKKYSYKKNKNLGAIHYMEDGRSHKTEYFDNKKRFSKIHYYNKKSSDLEKIEIYKKGALKKTKIYTDYNNYYVVNVSN